MKSGNLTFDKVVLYLQKDNASILRRQKEDGNQKI